VWVVSDTLRLTVVYEDAGDGWIMASIPELPGVFSQGRTRDEARAMVRDALREMLLAWAQTGANAPVTVPAGADSEPLELVIRP
jgi:predicted RNase H-like HicB family nuclease